VDAAALMGLIAEAIALNTAKRRKSTRR
jgi:hypothetical protein